MKRLFLTLCFLYVMSAFAWADDTLIIPLDFGGSISDEYIDSFIKAANELDGVRVMDYGERKALLDTHFITVENAKSDDLGMIDLAESGAAAYNDGEHQNADEMFAEAFKIALAHPEFLAVTGDAAEEMWIAGAFWLQIQLYISRSERLREKISPMKSRTFIANVCQILFVAIKSRVLQTSAVHYISMATCSQTMKSIIFIQDDTRSQKSVATKSFVSSAWKSTNPRF